ncbi:uncharacterized protein [Clytia hemisphaerica]
MKLLNWPCDKIKTTIPLVYIHGQFNVERETIPKEITCGARKWPIVDGQFKIFHDVILGSSDVILEWENKNGELERKKVQVDFVKDENERFFQPIYIVCKNTDGSFTSPNGLNNTLQHAIKKLQFNLRLIQVFFQESLHENHFERASFRLCENEAGEPDIKIMQSDLDIEDTKGMTPDDLYRYFHKELCVKFGTSPLCKYVAFMSCTRYHPPEGETDFTTSKIMSYARGHAALGGGRLALFGTGSLHTWTSSLDDLVKCFTDERMIDRTKFFDDSCMRGSYWANYSTTLGATIHEVGHCLDLAHTKHGIMARGHDDMNFFYTQVKGQTCHDTATAVHSKDEPLIGLDDSGKYKGAHWYRSSAALLNCHKWLRYSKSSQSTTQSNIEISLHPNLLGPYGCVGTEKVRFNSKEWLKESSLTKLVGIVFYYGEFLEGIQFQGVKQNSENGKECSAQSLVESPIYGSKTDETLKYQFTLQPHEAMESIQIRSGAWIDALQITTTLQSTQFLGGDGGDLQKLKMKGGFETFSWIGTADQYVTSLCFLTNRTDVTSYSKESPSNPSANQISFCSNNPVRLVEIYDQNNGEVTWYKEIEQSENTCDLSLDLLKIIGEKGFTVLKGSVWDCQGNSRRFEFGKNIFELIE